MGNNDEVVSRSCGQHNSVSYDFHNGDTTVASNASNNNMTVNNDEVITQLTM